MTVFIVAEAGVNYVERLPDGIVSHRPDLGLYRKDDSRIINLIEAAARAGADAVKFQAFSADALIQRRGIDPGSDTAQLLRAAELTDRNLDLIAEEAKANGIKWFYSVFSPDQIERVLSRGACALKIGHEEAKDSSFLFEVDELRGGHKGVPMYVSHTPDKMVQGSHFWRAVWCMPKYPADGHNPQLHMVGPRWGERGADHNGYENPHYYRGFSSHYTDYRIPAAAALRGAEYIEAHIMTSLSEPEAAWSLDVDDFANMVKLVREYESWL